MSFLRDIKLQLDWTEHIRAGTCCLVYAEDCLANFNDDHKVPGYMDTFCSTVDWRSTYILYTQDAEDKRK